MRSRFRRGLETLARLALCLLAGCTPPGGQISGRATVVDGDSLEIGGTSVRLFGVDAPEARQTCSRDGRVWACGETATRKLRALVGTRTLSCSERDIDAYGRTVAVCSNGELDLGAAMVEGGFALAYRRYSDAYVDEERRARDAGRGLWVGSFTPPWDWRSNPMPVAPGSSETPSGPGSGCTIKGNINREGARIYHVPGSRYYEDTRIDTGRGERWFCSESEARRAGWRAPRG